MLGLLGGPPLSSRKRDSSFVVKVSSGTSTAKQAKTDHRRQVGALSLAPTRGEIPMLSDDYGTSHILHIEAAC